MSCSKCGAENPAGNRFCSQCGSVLRLRCARCGVDNPPSSRFCGDCGNPLADDVSAAHDRSVVRTSGNAVGGGALQQHESLAAPDGERKTITALFADIKGSMELIEDLDPEQARHIIDPALSVMMEAIRRYGGHIVQSTGDGVFAIFGAPLAHEDHAQRALYAALRMQEDLNRYSGRMGAEGHKRVQARVGINTGEAVVRSLHTGRGRPEYTPIGHSIGLAARMEAISPIGSVAVTAETRKLCDGYFNFKPLGATRIRGVSAPVGVYEVTGLGPLRTHFQLSAERGLSKFVGRRREIELLEGAIRRVTMGHGQIVASLGDAGVGKSRLLHEFKATARDDCVVLETFALPHGKESSYLPVIELLKNYFGIALEDDKRRQREQRVARLLAVDSGRVFSPWRRRAREKVSSKVLGLDRRLEDTLSYLFSLLGIQDSSDPLAQMDGQVRRRRTLEAIKRILLRHSLNQPLMVIFEDLHWIDDETQTLLNLLADGIANARILLLVTYRPDYRHEWSNKSYYTQLRLDPLSMPSAEEMLDALIGNDSELTGLRRFIIDKTDGNPFFIEELVQSLFEQGTLQRNGSVKLTQSPAELKVPPTVQAVLASRIDRLGVKEKELLQTLAVIGRQFPLPLIRRVSDCSEIELDRMIATLQRGEFIYERPAFPEIEYVFKHELAQEVAYNSVLIERRRLLHERTALALEALFADSIEDRLADIAYHYSRSSNDTQAVDYLIRAAQQAQPRSAFTQAAAYFEEALTRLTKLPATPERDRKEIAIHAGLGDITIIRNGYGAPEYERHLTRRHELAQRLGDTTQIFYSLVGISVMSAFRLELNSALNIGMKLLGIADHEHDPHMQLEARGALANALWMMGDVAGARDHAERGLALFEHRPRELAGKEHMLAACQLYMCFCTAALGYPDKALRLAFEFLAAARERGQLLPLAFALNIVSTMMVWRGEGEQAVKYSDALLAVSVEHGFTNWVSFGHIDHGHALALAGKGREGVVEISKALDTFRSTGAAIPGWAFASLAFSCFAAAQPEEGMKAAASGLELAEKTGDRESEAELYRLQGELMLMRDPGASAEPSFRRAVDAARSRSAKVIELRATTCLARLLAAQGKRDEARAMLAEIYGWFSEGFDTADLRDARTLLDEWNN